MRMSAMFGQGGKITPFGLVGTDYTGQQAVREDDGAKFAELAVKAEVLPE